MKVLVLFALLACVYAAPSHYASVFPLTAVAGGSTITAADIEAADINARIKAENEERYVAEEARRTGQAYWSGVPAATGYIAGGSLAHQAAYVPGYHVSPLAYQAPFRTYPVAPIQSSFGHGYSTVLKHSW